MNLRRGKAKNMHKRDVRRSHQRLARVRLFREKFTEAVRLYKLHEGTLDQETISRAFQDAYALSPLETGEELKETIDGVPPTLDINFDQTYFQGLLNIYHLSQLHGHDLSKYGDEDLKRPEER